jgi:hypothetical protein
VRKVQPPLCLARPPSCSPATRHGASPPTSPSCRSCCASLKDLNNAHRIFGKLPKLFAPYCAHAAPLHLHDPRPIRVRRSARDSGKPLDGANKYTIHFGNGATPPANAFWSVTLYDAEGFPVASPLNRFAVSSWMPFQFNPDGSLDLYFQNESPGQGKDANWLPAPRGAFTLTLRIYAPKSEVLTGKWSPPPVLRSQAVLGLGGQ